MPILSVFWSDEDGDSIYLGTCEYNERGEFEKKVQSWCIAFGKQYGHIEWKHSYLNSLRGYH